MHQAPEMLAAHAILTGLFAVLFATFSCIPQTTLAVQHVVHAI